MNNCNALPAYIVCLIAFKLLLKCLCVMAIIYLALITHKSQNTSGSSKKEREAIY